MSKKRKKKLADLIDRLSGDSEFMSPPRDKINSHRFMGVERLYALGEWTRSEIATEFDLQGNEAIQATQLADKIDSFTGANGPFNKAVYIGRVEAIAYCLEDRDDNFYHNQDGTVNKTKVYEDLQITG